MDIICITQNNDMATKVKSAFGTSHNVRIIENVLDCLEIMNFDHPDAIIVDLSPTDVPNVDMLKMFPRRTDGDEYIPLIALDTAPQNFSISMSADFKAKIASQELNPLKLNQLLSA